MNFIQKTQLLRKKRKIAKTSDSQIPSFFRAVFIRRQGRHLPRIPKFLKMSQIYSTQPEPTVFNFHGQPYSITKNQLKS